MDRAGLQQAMARYSESSVYAIRRLLAGKGNPKQRCGAFKRKAAQVLGPFRACYEPVSIPNAIEGRKDIVFYMANMKTLLCLLVDCCASFAELLRRCRTTALGAVMAHDECTAGNVLNPLQTQKTCLFYITFSILKDSFAQSHSWIPVAALTHAQLTACKGGLGGATAAFVRAWVAQSLDSPFYVGQNLCVTVTLKAFLSDGESQRAAYSCKGSAGLKPCLFCSNVVARGCDAPARDASFVTISEHDYAAFQQYDEVQLRDTIVAWIPQKRLMSQQELDMRERCLGYRLDDAGVWGCPIARTHFTLSMGINDSMHSYFTTGILNTEIALLLDATHRETKMTTQELCTAALDAGWRRRVGVSGQSEVKRLFGDGLFGNESYRGSAEQTRHIAPLLRWFAEALWLPQVRLRAEAESFLQLCCCTDALRVCDEISGWSKLNEEQAKHHQLFSQVWPDHVRPKHHHRLHLGRQYEKLGFEVNCWGVESAHQSYKKHFSDLVDQFLTGGESDEAYSLHLMPRLLIRLIEMINTTPFLPDVFALINAFTSEEVEAATGIPDSRLSSRCRFHLFEVTEGDVLLWKAERTEAAIVNFFLLRRGQLLLHVAMLALSTRTAATRVFRKTNEERFIQWSSLHKACLPTWISLENDTIIVLP
eukprot:s1575_g5.t1